MATKLTAFSLMLAQLMAFLVSPGIAAPQTPAAWEPFAANECTRESKEAWAAAGRAEQKEIPAASCSDFALFSSNDLPDLLVHQTEYTGGGGFYRWFALEALDPNKRPHILTQDRKSTARFVSIAGEFLLEQFDGEFITLSRWGGNDLQTALHYRANDFAFQSGPVFGALRALDPKTKTFWIVKYSAKGREAIINAKYTWSVDEYRPTSKEWVLTKNDLPFSKELERRLKKMDPHFSEQLASAKNGNFTFDEDFGWRQH